MFVELRWEEEEKKCDSMVVSVLIRDDKREREGEAEEGERKGKG